MEYNLDNLFIIDHGWACQVDYNVKRNVYLSLESAEAAAMIFNEKMPEHRKCIVLNLQNYIDEKVLSATEEARYRD